MFDIINYIDNYADNHGIEKYDLKGRVLTLKDFNKPQTFAPGIAFFYDMKVTGEIVNVSDIENPFLFVETPTEIFDFAQIATIKDYGTIQTAESNLIIVADNMLTVNMSVNTLFQTVHSAQFYYLYLTILQRENAEKKARKAYNNDSLRVDVESYNFD